MKQLVLVLGVLVGMSAFADLFYLKKEATVGTATAWFSRDSYNATKETGGEVSRLPGPGDEIVLPYRGQAYVDDDSIAFISSMRRIDNMDTGTTPRGSAFVINITTNAELHAVVNSSTAGIGNYPHVQKRGPGRLTLKGRGVTKNGANLLDYYTAFDVQEGELRYETDDTTSGTVFFREVCVQEGAVLSISYADGNLSMNTLSGGGLVTNLTSQSHKLILYSSPDVASNFWGNIHGTFVFNTSLGHQYLSGTNNTFTSVSLYGSDGSAAKEFGLTKFGRSGGESSIGSASSIGTSSSYSPPWLTYLGTGEETDKSISVQNKNDYPLVIDGGAHGGLAFVGDTVVSSSGTAMMRRILLTGSNAVPCTVKGGFSETTGRPFHISKSGTGQWNLVSTRTNAGAYSVLEGTLGFDCLDETGLRSSLGYSTCLYADVVDIPSNDTHKVEYAVRLGGGASEAVLAHTATDKGVSVSSRLAEVAGAARFDPGTTPFKWSGVRGAEDTLAASNVLALGGSTETNFLANVRGPMSIVKDGPGTWTLSGELSFTGRVDVKEGRLVVHNPSGKAFTWFRYTMKANAATSPLYPEFSPSSSSDSRCAWVGEIGVFDAAGHRTNIGLGQTEDYTAVAPGEAAAARWETRKINDPGNDLIEYFDNENKSPRSGNNLGCSAYFAKQGELDPDNPATWVPVVFRMTNGAPAVASWDVMPTYCGQKSMPVHVMFEGSTDGIVWEHLHETNAIGKEVTLTGNYKWARDNSSVKSPHQGYPVHSTPTNAYDQLTGVTAVSVSTGAALVADGAVTLKALALDPSGAGTIDGFAFADAGVLTLPEGFGASGTAMSTRIAVGFRNCTGVGNISDWSVRVGDEPSDRFVLSANESGVTVSRRGLILIVR